MLNKWTPIARFESRHNERRVCEDDFFVVLGWDVTANDWEKLNRRVSKPGCFPLFLGKVQIVSRTFSGLFLVGALNRPRKRKRTHRENTPDHPRANRESPRKTGKVPKRTKKDKKGRTSPDREPPPFETPPPPRLAALETNASDSKNRSDNSRYPKDPAVLKILRRINSLSPYYFTVCGDLLWLFPWKTRCFRDPAVLFCYRRIFCHHRSELIWP